MSDERNLWSSASAPPDTGPPGTAPPPPRPTSMPTAFCRACGQSIDARAVICPKCGVPQSAVAPTPFAPQTPEEKSPGLAILLSFLWPGSGHLYVGSDTEKGIAFTCISGLCFLISLTIVGLVLT